MNAVIREVAQGYGHPDYVHSLSEWGEPMPLTQSEGWLLRRRVPNGDGEDAMGCYPLFTCANWHTLDRDLEEAGERLISVALVTDPFAPLDETQLKALFPDVMRHYKDHFVIDLRKPVESFISGPRQKRIRKNMAGVSVEYCDTPIQYLDDWCEAYGNLVRRHHVTGLRVFSRAAFARQLSMPGMSMLRAEKDGQLLGMHLYLLQGDVAHCHLGAYTDAGYAVGATHTLDWHSTKIFASMARWINLGGGAGVNNDGSDGLTAYKRSWSTDTRPVYFCGRIFDRQRYDELSKLNRAENANYFPRYRAGEYG